MTAPVALRPPARTAPVAPADRAGGRSIDRLFGLYALASGTALLFPHRPDAWPLLLMLHLALAAVTLRVGPIAAPLDAIGRRWPRAARVLSDWYPLLLIPALYGELAVLNRAVYASGYFDPLILAAEQAIFGGQPSQALAVAVPSLFVSELLHGAYLSYYPLIYAPPLLLYLAGRLDAFRRVAFAVMLTFFLHYLVFIYFPVQGPRYLFAAPVGEAAQGPLYHLAHAILEAGSSQGAAFPSSHVAVAVVQTLVAGRLLPRLFPVLTLLTVGLGLGTVYGGFHYATDAVAGLVLGLALAAAAPAIQRRI